MLNDAQAGKGDLLGRVGWSLAWAGRRWGG